MIDLKALPKERGIYQITTGSVSYVGISDNIQLRVKQHLDSSSCRSRIILDTNKAKIVVLELLPDSDDKTLALREWYWFSKLKRKGHIMVNDPKTLGKTKSGQFFPPQNKTATTTVSQWLPFSVGLKLAGVTTVIVAFFSFGFFTAGKLIEQTSLSENDSDVEQETVSENTPLTTTDPDRASQENQPLDACITPLRSGAAKEAVTVLQRQLKALGYYQGELDGVYGPGTEGAVSQFQRDSNLGVDGIVGCDTQVAINEALQN